MVMIPAFQAGGPGSIPGRRTFLQEFCDLKFSRPFSLHYCINASSAVWSSGMILA